MGGAGGGSQMADAASSMGGAEGMAGAAGSIGEAAGGAGGYAGAAMTIAESFKEDDKSGSDFTLSGSAASPNPLSSFIGIAGDTGLTNGIRNFGNDMYKGANSIMDTFYVTPSSKDWQQNASMTDESIKYSEDRRKERVDRKENQFVKDTGNKQFMMENMTIEGMPIMDYYKEMYPDKSETYIKEKAVDRVESELGKMKGYAQYGMNAEEAYPLYKSQKAYGYNTEEAINAAIGFNRFNSNAENVSHINNSYNVNASSVSDAIPNAEKYYHNGYTNVEDMRKVDFIQRKLNVALEEAIKIDQVLRNKGSINCSAQKDNESTQEYEARKRMYQQINDLYKRRGN